MPRVFKPKRLLIASLLAPCSLQAAELQNEQCHQFATPVISTPVPQDKMQISTDQLRVENRQIYSLYGHVEVLTQQQTLETDSAHFDYLNQTLQAEGNINYRQSGLMIQGNSLNLDFLNASGQARQTFYAISPSNGNGYADNIEFKDKLLRLNDADYSTCPPDKKAWLISAKEITINHEENEVVARNAKVTVFSMPVLYIPYISFPLQGRKSGFLAPEPAYSTTDGLDLRIPYYLNLAPNYDLTLNPRFIQKRGAQFGSELRYLQNNFKGQAGAEYLAADQKTKNNRYQLHFSQQNYLSPASWLQLDMTHVSDVDYYSDLGTNLSTANQSQLNRHMIYETRGDHWYFSSLLQDYQMLNYQTEPYRRLPQLNLSLNRNLNRVNTNLYSQYSYFYRQHNDKVQRLVVNPSVSLPLEQEYGYLQPSAGIYSGIYHTEESQLNTLQGYFHTTGALFFERETDSGKQTLEPRFSYLLIPEKSQSKLPLIDSDSLMLSYDELFHARRYSGWDRFGDIHRITGALENRWADPDGIDRLSLNLALAHILEQQRENFNGDRAMNRGDNIYAISTATQLTKKLKGSGDILSINNLQDVESLSLAALLSQNPTNQMELRYDFRSNLLQQTSFIYTRSISSQWRIATRWSYSHNHQQIREGLAGLEYNNCCWSVRLVGRHYASVVGEDGKNAVALQFELKGLTAIGSKLEDTFSQELFGIQ